MTDINKKIAKSIDFSLLLAIFFVDKLNVYTKLNVFIP